NTTYTVVVTDVETGCTASDTVNVVAESGFVIPDAFTPNGDGQNDYFEIIERGAIVVKEFRIYNRWGEEISTDGKKWDGTYKGKAQPVGTYSYYAVVQLANGERKVQKGVFSLLR
ncbi:MAG TPA: gliding motility-associated C-terminal domain-containing protein, partial [Chitinophagales bacterium]|nr:gliding motility-associated C-terminal domain-containing protein [Chitinophagales bacterium]